MVRISAIFIAACMVLIAGSIGVVVFLRFGFTGAESALVALGVLTALAVYNAIAARKHDRLEASNQLANLARGSGDLAQQLAEFGRRLGAMEGKVDTVIDRALATAQPLAAEIEELSSLVKQLADSVAAHEVALATERQPTAVVSVEASAVIGAVATAAAPQPAIALPAATAPPVAIPPPEVPATAAAPGEPKIAAFAGLDRDGIIAAIAKAIDASKIDLYLQPVVTLPQRKVRYYEAFSRLRAERRSGRRRRFPALCRSRRFDAEARSSFGPALRAGGAAASSEEPRYRSVLQRIRRDAHRYWVSEISRIHGSQSCHRAVAGVRIHAKRGARHGADRA